MLNVFGVATVGLVGDEETVGVLADEMGGMVSAGVNAGVTGLTSIDTGVDSGVLTLFVGTLFVEGLVSVGASEFEESIDATVGVATEAAVVVSVAVEGVAGSGASRLRLRSSAEPPQAAAVMTSAESSSDKRREGMSETLFSRLRNGSSADEVGLAHDRQAQEKRLQQQVFGCIQSEVAHRAVDVVDGLGEVA